MTLGQHIYVQDPTVSEWPSPEQLKFRIILVGKKLTDLPCNGCNQTKNDIPNNVECGYVSEEDENIEFARQKISRTRKVVWFFQIITFFK